jgi:tRNA threonylcarbamoyladenosine biosynthesis protein TsaE
VTSPTFAIGHRYRLTDPAVAGLVAVSHLDLYRLGDLGAEDPDLLADYISPDAVAFVEWPGRAEDTISQFGRIRYWVALAHAGGDRRRVEISGR